MACSSLTRGLLHSTASRSAWLQRGGTAPGPAPTCLAVRAVEEERGWRAAVSPEDCNEEDCAPEKEVGKVSMEWKASESTKLMGTYPPINKKKWTGYVEKDTAGQTNIYAVEPTVYVSENVISSNTAGDSSAGSEQTLLVAGGLGLALLLGAALVLQGVNTSSPTPQLSSSDSYMGPTLSYYIQKFTPPTSPAITSLDAPSPPLFDFQLQSE